MNFGKLNLKNWKFSQKSVEVFNPVAIRMLPRLLAAAFRGLPLFAATSRGLSEKEEELRVTRQIPEGLRGMRAACALVREFLAMFFSTSGLERIFV